MGSREIIESFKQVVMTAEAVLNTKYSFELAEPHYLHCLEIIRAHPCMRSEFASTLIGLYQTKMVSDEPIAYLMHVLRWHEIASWAEERLGNSPDAIATGASLEKVLAAYNDKWENKEFYVHL